MRLCRVAAIQRLVEVGAYDGRMSHLFTLGDTRRRAIAVDANPTNVNRMVASGLGDQVTILHVAANNKEGETSFFVPKLSNRGPSDLHGSTKRREVAIGFEKISVPSTTLDKIVSAKIPGEDFALWIDVEGAELDVLEGGRREISQHCRIIYLELESGHYWHDGNSLSSTVNLLETMGFVFLARDWEFRHQFNAIFVRERELSEFDFEIQKFGAGSSPNFSQLSYWFVRAALSKLLSAPSRPSFR